uniref:Reverse transcriptase zinc-binding domain-containing protein n=1 Tax=Quercus lobata TaxID=97700 RepID=A0A7N2LCN5_QUELO
MPGCSTQGKIQAIWNGIWNLQVPHIVKHMIWRATHNALPTLCNLGRRNVVSCVRCWSCKSESEDTVHALWKCSSLFVLWEPDGVLKKLLRYNVSSFADLWMMVLDNRHCLDVNLLAIIFWMIWSRRNSVRLGEAAIEIRNIRQQARLFLQDFLEAQDPKRVCPRVIDRAIRWIPPIHPRVKVNFDGATFNSKGSAGLGIVIQDGSGGVVGAMTERVHLPSSPAVVEAMACRRALLFAQEQGCVDCSVEGDAEVIINSIVAREVLNRNMVRKFKMSSR